MRRLASLSLALILGLLSGCAASGPPHKLTWRTLSRGLTSGISEPRRVVLHAEAPYLRLWAEHAAQADRVALPPAVNFDREMVLFVSMGTQPTGGYFIEIVDVELRGDQLRILVGERRPQPGAFQIQQLTQPYHLVALPAVHARVDFRDVRPAGVALRRNARPGDEGTPSVPTRTPRSPARSPRGASSAP
ncbi:MAG: protease complex subunit PrcB family protein [Verrucomicrobiae bacterium]|nr:protease complex subunit PrcB family protein [Verrucomicrobiae bacterium]